MPSRFYFPSSGSAAISPAVDAGWEREKGSGLVRLPSPRTKSNTSFSATAYSFGSTSTSETIYYQFITDAISQDVTIASNIEMVMRCAESGNTADLHLAFSLRVIGPDLTVRGTLLQYHTTSSELATSLTTRVHDRALTAVEALAGDRLCLEIGAHGVTPVSDATGTFELGDPTATADFTYGAGQTDQLVGWWQIEQDLPFGTRFYLPSTGTAPSSPDVDGGWEGAKSTGGLERFLAVQEKIDSAQVTTSFNTGVTGTTDIVFFQYVSDTLNVNQTISGTVTMAMRTREIDAAHNMHLAYALRVLQGDTSTVRGTLATFYANSTEFNTAFRSRVHVQHALSTVNALAGDRIVLELGVHMDSSTGTPQGNINIGDLISLTDMPAVEESGSNLCPWWELNDVVLTFGTPSGGPAMGPLAYYHRRRRAA